MHEALVVKANPFDPLSATQLVPYSVRFVFAPPTAWLEDQPVTAGRSRSRVGRSAHPSSHSQSELLLGNWYSSRYPYCSHHLWIVREDVEILCSEDVRQFPCWTPDSQEHEKAYPR